MKKDLRTLLLGGALVAGSLGSVVAFAQTGGAQGNSQTQNQMQSQEAAIQGSIPIAQGSAQYADMATVSLGDAVSAAQQSVGSSATPASAELEVENGFLVWDVTLGNQEVLVDAGNGSVLQTMQAEMEDGSEDESENEGTESAENESGENESEND